MSSSGKDFYSKATEYDQGLDEFARKISNAQKSIKLKASSLNADSDIKKAKNWIRKIQRLESEAKESNFKDYEKPFTKLIEILKKAPATMILNLGVTDIFIHLRNKIESYLPNKKWLLENVFDDEKVSFVLLYKSTKEIAISEIFDKTIIDKYHDRFTKYLGKIKEIVYEKVSGDYVMLLPSIYKTIKSNFASITKIFNKWEDAHQLKKNIKIKILEELKFKKHLFGLDNDKKIYKKLPPDLDTPRIDDEFLQFVNQCNNIKSFHRRASKILRKFEERWLKLKYKCYDHNFEYLILEKLKNPIGNQETLEDDAKFLCNFKDLIQLANFELLFSKIGGNEFINQLKSLQIRLSQRMEEFFIRKLDKNLEVCLRVTELFMINLDAKNNTLFNFSSIYNKYQGKYNELIADVYDKLIGQLEKNDMKSFLSNFLRLQEMDKFNFVNNYREQIVDRLKTFVEEALDEDLPNYNDIIISFFRRAKDISLIFEYIGPENINFDIIQRLEMRNKNWTGKIDKERCRPIVKMLPKVIRKRCLWDFRCFGAEFEDRKDLLKSKQLPKIIKMVKNLPKKGRHTFDRLALVTIKEIEIDIRNMISNKKFIPALQMCINQKIWDKELINKIPESALYINRINSLLIPMIEENINELELERNKVNFKQKFSIYKKNQLLKTQYLVKEILKSIPLEQLSEDCPNLMREYWKLLKVYESSIQSFLQFLTRGIIQKKILSKWRKRLKK